MAGGSPRLRLPAALLALFAWALAGPAVSQRAAQVPDDDLSRGAPSRTLDSGVLRAVYLDLLGRPPYRAERDEWLGRQLADLLGELTRGEELWEHWTEEQLYYFLLIDNFRPRSDRVVAIPGDLREGRIGVRDAIHRIVLSSSFDQRNPGPDTFVTVVMEQLLGLTVQKQPRELHIGKQLYDGQEGMFLGRRGRSQADVVKISIEDRRCLSQLLEREYRRLLRRDPDRRELARWTKRLDKDPLAYRDLFRDWIQSEAYEQRLSEEIVQPNRLYVRSMYVDLVDRLPDKEEERRMRNALDGLSDPGPLRAVLARLLLDSGTAALPAKDEIEDPTAWVGGLFERLYGRAATPTELKSFVTAFHDPACRPATVLYALVSHPEYHSF
ncbi:MAG: hypothetical protein AAF682_22310 [Planctomycetota bacterium]